jgi:hypothetical protein
MKTLVTIDWDFYVPEKPEWDWGHQESLLFLDIVWRSRLGLYEAVKTSGTEVGFWKELGRKVDMSRCKLNLSDSHCFVYLIANEADTIILFDAHHDCWHGDNLGVDKEDHNIYCHNWLREWLIGSQSRRLIWVKPEWADERFVVPEDLEDRVEVLGYGDRMPVDRADWLHICRSGCWTPPWLDEAFVAFVKASGKDLKKANLLQNGEWNPLKVRWSKAELKKALANEAKIQKKLRAMVVGTMKSSSFLNYKTVQTVKG